MIDMDNDIPTADFIRTFEPPLDFMFWISLLEEETAELDEALLKVDSAVSDGAWDDVLKEAADLVYVGFGALLFEPPTEVMSNRAYNRAESAASRAQQILQETGERFEEIGVDFHDVLHKAIYRVHRSNMSKCDPDTGEPIRDPDTGKILKGPHYEPPVLGDLLCSEPQSPERQ